MDYTDEEPTRWWVLNQGAHSNILNCVACDRQLDPNKALPATALGVFCEECAPEQVKEHPVTATYLSWYEQGDPRWWSPYLCNCKGCGVEELSVSK